MSQWIEVGQEAPDFSLPTDNGEQVKLSRWRGQPIVLYFYPRDDTPGCTKEAAAFRDQGQRMKALGATVIGVSTDDVASHQKFRDKHGLNFPLLADTEHRVAETYGAWREKVRNGKTSLGIQRSTFLIDAGGVVRKVWKNVNVDGHDQEVIKALEQLAAGE
jgi:peroxiredoxin Q/BCP